MFDEYEYAKELLYIIWEQMGKKFFICGVNVSFRDIFLYVTFISAISWFLLGIYKSGRWD